MTPDRAAGLQGDLESLQGWGGSLTLGRGAAVTHPRPLGSPGLGRCWRPRVGGLQPTPVPSASSRPQQAQPYPPSMETGQGWVPFQALHNGGAPELGYTPELCNWSRVPWTRRGCPEPQLSHLYPVSSVQLPHGLGCWPGSECASCLPPDLLVHICETLLHTPLHTLV